jgi:dipeptide/tripeptide permease
VLWMALAFGVGVVMFVAVTLFLVTLIGRAANGHMWIGALVTGLLQIGVGAWLVKRGISAMIAPSYSLEDSRNALADTANWVTSGRKR